MNQNDIKPLVPVGAIRKRKNKQVEHNPEKVAIWVSLSAAICREIGATMLTVSTDDFSCILPNRKLVFITDEDVRTAMATGDYINALLEMKS